MVPVESTNELPQPYCVAVGATHAFTMWEESSFRYGGTEVKTFRIYEKVNYY